MCMKTKPYGYVAEDWKGLTEVAHVMGCSTARAYGLYTSGLSKIGRTLYRQLRRTEPTPTELQTLINDEAFLILVECLLKEKKI